jgi:hypothetical protein
VGRLVFGGVTVEFTETESFLDDSFEFELLQDAKQKTNAAKMIKRFMILSLIKKVLYLFSSSILPFLDKYKNVISDIVSENPSMRKRPLAFISLHFILLLMSKPTLFIAAQAGRLR